MGMSININSDFPRTKFNNKNQNNTFGFGKNNASMVLPHAEHYTNPDNEKNYITFANNRAIINKVNLKFNNKKDISFGATFWENVAGGAILGAGTGGTTGLCTDAQAFGTLCGIPTLVGTAAGGVIGGVGGAIAHFKIKRDERLEREEEKLRIEREKLEKQRQELKKLQDSANQKTQEALQELETKIAENQHLLEINEKYNTKILEIKNGFGLGRIAGYNDDKMALNEAFLSPFIKSMSNSDVCEKVPNGVLLYGLTGNGKTTLARGLAEQALGDKIETNYYELTGNGKEVVEDLKEIREKASEEFKNTGQRSIVFIDEFDGIALEQNKLGYNGANNGYLKEFLNDCSESGITVIAATNHPRNIEEAFIINKRRFGVQTLLEPPTKQDIKGILDFYLNGVADDTVKYEELSEAIGEKANNRAEKYTCSAIETITKEAKAIGEKEKRLVSQQDLLEVINSSGTDISQRALRKFKKDFKYMSNGMTYDEYLAKKEEAKQIKEL